jgi:hypothetical protein
MGFIQIVIFLRSNLFVNYGKQSHADRITKDGISLLGCVPTGAQYNKPTHTEYSGSYNEKPIYPAKAKKEANLDPYSYTFKGRTTYGDAYLSWPANPRCGFKPPGFHSHPMALEGKTSYTYDYWDKLRPVQPWRKSEHWPHTYSLCETHHPRKLESMPSKPLDTASQTIPANLLKIQRILIIIGTGESKIV